MSAAFDALFGETFGMVGAQLKKAGRIAYAEDQARDERGRFGEGSGDLTSIVQTVRDTGGITMSPLDGSSPTTGYVVARPDVKGDIVKADDFFGGAGPAMIMAFMDAHADAFDGPGEYLGLWHDTAHGEIALDAVEVIEDRAEAERAGAERDEQAIWDVAAGAEIPTGGTGHRAATVRGTHGRPTDAPRQAAEAVESDDARGTTGVGRERAPGDGRGGGLTRAQSRAVAQLTKLRQSLGTRLLANAQLAYEAALRSAGVKVIGRARSRTSATRQRQVRTAVTNREPLAPILAAVGLSETEMLAHAFDAFHEQTVDEVERYRTRVQAVVERLTGQQLAFGDPSPIQVADFLVAGLTAMARSRLMLGDQAALLAAAPRLTPRRVGGRIVMQVARELIKRAPRGEPDNFDLPAGLPSPDELASAAARLVRNALFAADGRVHVQLPATPDRLPTVVSAEPTMPPSLEEQLVVEFNVAPVWRWAHGFYGDPLRPFDPHVDLDGFETTDREGDPDLFNGDTWPESDLFHPGDHEGCTCEWVVAVD